VGHLVVLLAALVVGAFTALTLVVFGLVTVGSSERRARAGWTCGAALLAVSAAVLVYLWGILHLTWAVVEAEDGGTGSSPPMPCREAGDRVASHVIDYDVGYLPLRFVCRLNDGRSYSSSTVPVYVNPAVVVLALTGGVLAAETRRRTSRRNAVPANGRSD
jgi:hypothetical protein